MSTSDPEPPRRPDIPFAPGYEQYDSSVIDEERPHERRALVPLLLFLATCASTYMLGETMDPGHGWMYAVPLMVTLMAHEFGHFLQAVRYRVPASWPYFIPMPYSPLGTMGAVIVFRGHMGNRKALFDIGITGPLAGLVPALIFSVVGLHLSEVREIRPGAMGLGEPLVFQWLREYMFGPLPPGSDVFLHPLAYAGWVGIFVTAFNLIPIGQLDGGHILYTLLRKKAGLISQILLLAAFVYMIYSGNYSYLIIFVLLGLVGTRHPPTADDNVPLGAGRVVLGWLTLAFFIIGFTPRPFMDLKPAAAPPRPDFVAAPDSPPLEADSSCGEQAADSGSERLSPLRSQAPVVAQRLVGAWPRDGSSGDGTWRAGFPPT